MAFRIKTAIIVLVGQSLLAAPRTGTLRKTPAGPGPNTAAVHVRHRHWRHGGPGELRVTAEGLAFQETGKHRDHSRVWKYSDIQQLELTETTLRVLTYEDRKREFGRDREFVFDELPRNFAKSVYPQWKDQLDQRFVAAIADPEITAMAEFPAKLTALTRGVEGTLVFADDRIVFRAAQPGESRTWRFTDIENIASAGSFDFSVVTLEHHGSWNTATREFRFQLQRPMEEARYNELWRRVLRVHQPR
jgi:hypothetical protein